MLQSHYHIGNIDCNMESLKKSFSVLTLLAPPGNCDEFDQLQNSSANNELEEMLHQPAERRASVSKTVFIKGRQETLDDVIALLANVMILDRFWVTFDGNDTTTYPYVLRQLSELADVLTTSEFRTFAGTMKGACPFLAHTLIVNTFNFFAGFIKLAKNPHVVREVKVSQTIDLKGIKVSSLIMRNLLEQLQLCVATGSQQNLFARPPASFAIFCPVLSRGSGGNVNFSPVGWKNHHKSDNMGGNGSSILRSGSSRESRGATRKRSNSDISLPDQKTRSRNNSFSSANNGADAPLAGSIVNITGKKLFFPPGMSQRYCASFLDTNEACKFGDKCNFKHCKFPKDFPSEDIAAMMDLVSKTRGLSWNPTLRLPTGFRE